MGSVRQFWSFVAKLDVDLLLKYLFCCFIIYFPHIYLHLANGMHSPLNLFTRPQLQELMISYVAVVYGFGANEKQFRQNHLCFQLYVLITSVLTMFSEEALLNYSSSLTLLWAFGFCDEKWLLNRGWVLCTYVRRVLLCSESGKVTNITLYE
jgi:hypothetical protein